LACSVEAVILAQATGSQFEVASLKVSPKWSGQPPPPVPTMSGGPGSNVPTRFSAHNWTLQMLIRYAFALKPEEYGTKWLREMDFSGPKFDLDVEIAPGTIKEQFLVMLQNLLVERFALKFHREPMEISVYHLVRGKKVLRLKENSEPAASGDAQLHPGPNGTDGFPTVPAGQTAYFPQYSGSVIKWKFYHFSMERLADMLWSILDKGPLGATQPRRPVFDRTGLKGFYDFYLEYTVDNSADISSDSQVSVGILGALDALGLKLQPDKASTNVFVVDHFEATPSAN
jgi:uncharacterized protein (TIGR03435 family)